jgi:preprotein translocase subunit SecY
MVRIDDIESADRLSRRRARMLPVLAIVFIVQQASYFSARIEDGARAVDQVKISAWLVLSVVLLLALTTGGFWFRPAPVRDLLNDEVTRANRVEGLRVGFIATMAAGIAMYFLTLFEPVTGRDAIHLLMTVGIAAALLRFGQLERRAHRGG